MQEKEDRENAAKAKVKDLFRGVSLEVKRIYDEAPKTPPRPPSPRPLKKPDQYPEVLLVSFNNLKPSML